MANLHQLNVKFDPFEDRLTLSIRSDDNSEILLWLTRRYTGLLLGILEKLVNEEGSEENSSEAKEAINSFQREAALSKADFASEYDQTSASHPLGEQPLLASRIEYKPASSKSIDFAFGLQDGRNINLNLNRELMFALIKLLEDGTQKAEWNIGAASDAELEDAHTSVPANTPLH